jgi:hypothetical protein
MGELVFAILVTAGNRSRLLSGFYRQRVDIDRIFQRCEFAPDFLQRLPHIGFHSCLSTLGDYLFAVWFYPL